MDPENLGPQIFDLNRTMNNKQCSQAESPPHLHNNTALILFLQQISSSSPIDQISKILRLVPEQHAQAESLFNLCKQTNAKELAEKLVQLIERSPRLHMRAMSAILLPNTLLQKPSKLRPSLWNTLPKLRSSVNLGLLNCVKDDQNKPIIIILANTISKLTADNRFPELKPFMFKGFNLPRDWVCCCCCCCFETVKWLKESALLIFAQLGDQYVEGYLVHHQTDLHGVFKDCLENGDIRITALSAVIKFIRCLTHTNMLSFKDLLPNMLKCVTEASNEATAQKVLLIELAGTWSSFFTDEWPYILTIATENSEDGTRHWAIELVITLAASNNYDLPLPQPIINSLCEILMRMLLDIEDEAAWHSAENEDEAAWHSAENEDEDAGRSSNYIFSKGCLHKLATALDWNTIWNTIVQVVYEYLSAPNHEWQKHRAGLVALVQFAKGHSKLGIPNLKQVVTTVVNSIESYPHHPRVRWAAINAVGQLYANLDRNLQFKYHTDVLELLDLVKALLKDTDSRVRLAAINAVGQLYAKLCSKKKLYANLNFNFRFAYPNDVLRDYVLRDYVLLDLVEAISEDTDSRVRLAAINAVGQLYANLKFNFQFEYPNDVLPDNVLPDNVLLGLVEAISEDTDSRVRLAAINVTVQLFADLTDQQRETLLHTLHGAIRDFNYLLVQDHAVSAMISISINYPLDTRDIPHILRITVGTLLELRRREDIALDQTRIRAIRDTLEAFEENLPRDTWTSTFNRLRPEQQAEFRSIREEDDES